MAFVETFICRLIEMSVSVTKKLERFEAYPIDLKNLVEEF